MNLEEAVAKYTASRGITGEMTKECAALDAAVREVALAVLQRASPLNQAAREESIRVRIYQLFGNGGAHSPRKEERRMSHIQREKILEAVGRGWCQEETSDKELDVSLANAIVDEIILLLESDGEPASSKESA
ncbi:MAG: hypothetical protein EHM35_00895 [Planctomycetaceae bacterium]|nr:MAG: hypothetical protein EHM35_00895 [Planctomycetaceae bacterium]